jgi:DNA-binding CsgD family transcriptional regulator
MEGGMVVARTEFVGRETEMTVAEECLTAVAGGQPGLIVCFGEAGAGKTRLAREAMGVASRRGFLVAWGTADDTAGTPPHWPWQQVLRSLAARTDLLGLAEQSRLRSELGRLVPDIFDAPAEDTEMVGSDEDRFRQFDAVARLLRGLCRQQPLALVFDDVHWVDEASLLLLRHVVIGLGSEPLLLWVNAREKDQRHPHVLDELCRSPLVSQIRLGGLSESSVRRHLELITGSAVTDAQVAGVLALTGGNPFFVGEAARALVEQQDGRRGHLVTRGARNAISARLRRLSPASVESTRAAAVLGYEFDLRVVGAMTGMENSDALGWVGEAERAGLIEPTDSAGIYRFVHALVRDATEETLDPAERIALHRRAAEALEKHSTGARATELFEIARHWSQAAAGGQRAVAAEWIGRAGELAMRQLAYEDAARLYQEAARIGGTEIDDRTRCALLIGAGRAMSRFGALRDRQRVCLEAAEIARRQSWVELVGEAALALEAVGEPELDLQARRLCQEVLGQLGPEPSPLTGRLTARFAETFIYLADAEAAERASGDAVDLAQRCGDPQALAAALRARQIALAGPDGLAERERVAERLIDLGGHGTNPDVELQGLLCLVDVCLERGELARAAGQLDRAQSCADEMGAPLSRYLVANARAHVTHALGHSVQARRIGAEAFGVGGWGDHPEPGFRRAALLATVARHLGADQEVLIANRIGDDGVRSAAETPKAPFISDLASAHVLVMAGRLPEAADVWVSIGPPEQWHPPPHVVLLSAAFGLEVAIALGRPDDVDALRQRLAPHRGRHVACGLGAATYLGPVELWLGKAARFLGQLDEAEADLVVAEQLCRDCGAAGYRVESAFELAAALATRRRPGDLEQAQELLSAASREAGVLQMTPYLERIDNRLSHLTSPSDPLTRREREIAALISEGLSNREIADRLFVSERTAQNHVQHILTKLGLPNRGQVALWYERTHRSVGPEMSS